MNGSKIYAIGEIASAHGGDPLEVIKILDEFSNKGFQYIKFQVFSLEKLVNIYDDENSALKTIEISPLNWRKIFNYISDNKRSFCKINFIAEPYDLSSLSLCSEFKFFDSYKLPTSDLSNLNLLEKILKHTKNIYLGTGGSKFEEISKTVNFIKNNFKDININLIHGFQAYPTDIQDMDLWKISYLKKQFSLKVGFADHADASSQVLRYLPSCMAITYGADFIEKHITIKREEQKPDYYSSLNPNEVNEFLFAIQQTKKLTLKSECFELSKNELEYRQSMKKYACALIKIKRGDHLTLENITFKRSNKGKFSLFQQDYLLGKITNKDLEEGHTILPEDLL
tara:strand:+ start:59746 stop:60765 length:1020 start_codon:yes stop_codon:yes gene_type:complete